MPTVTAKATGLLLRWTAPAQASVKEYWIYARNDGNTAVTTAHIVAKLAYGTDTFFYPYDNFNESSNVTFHLKSVSWAGKSSSLSAILCADTTTIVPRFGNTASYTEMGDSGQISFIGNSGIPHACISCLDNTADISVTASSVFYKHEYFTANETSYILSADHTNNHITITKAGNFLVTCSIVAESLGGAAYSAHFVIMKNSGSANISGLHAHRNLAGGGGDKGSINIAGIVTVTASTTLELWIANDDNDADIRISDCTLSTLMVGG